MYNLDWSFISQIVIVCNYFTERSEILFRRLIFGEYKNKRKLKFYGYLNISIKHKLYRRLLWKYILSKKYSKMYLF